MGRALVFRLKGASEADGREELVEFLNTGTLAMREGRWQAVAWQATRVPMPEAEARNQVAAVDSALRMRASYGHTATELA
jgi:hypothetical protein